MTNASNGAKCSLERILVSLQRGPTATDIFKHHKLCMHLKSSKLIIKFFKKLARSLSRSSFGFKPCMRDHESCNRFRFIIPFKFFHDLNRWGIVLWVTDKSSIIKYTERVLTKTLPYFYVALLALQMSGTCRTIWWRICVSHTGICQSPF